MPRGSSIPCLPSHAGGDAGDCASVVACRIPRGTVSMRASTPRLNRIIAMSRAPRTVSNRERAGPPLATPVRHMSAQGTRCCRTRTEAMRSLLVVTRGIVPVLFRQMFHNCSMTVRRVAATDEFTPGHCAATVIDTSFLGKLRQAEGLMDGEIGQIFTNRRLHRSLDCRIRLQRHRKTIICCLGTQFANTCLLIVWIFDWNPQSTQTN